MVTLLQVFFIGLYFVPVVTIGFIYGLFVYPQHLLLPAAIFFTFVLIDFMIPLPLQNEWKELRHFISIYNAYKRYFTPGICFFDAKINPKGRYIYAFHPHGVYPMAGMGTEPFKEFNISAAGASVLSYVPFLRRVMSWFGVFPATRENMLKVMHDSSPGTLFMHSVGGISEMFCGMGEHEDIIINRRRGWLKIALQSGFDGIIPVYTLGTNFAYTRFSWAGPGTMFNTLSKQLQISIVPFYGRFFFLPWRIPVCTSVGNVIPLPKLEGSPTEDDVDKLQEEFKSEVKRIYYRGREEIAKHASEWKTRELVFDQIRPKKD